MGRTREGREQRLCGSVRGTGTAATFLLLHKNRNVLGNCLLDETRCLVQLYVIFRYYQLTTGKAGMEKTKVEQCKHHNNIIMCSMRSREAAKNRFPGLSSFISCDM